MNRTRCYPLWKRAYHIFLLACMFVISKDVPLHNYGRTFFLLSRVLSSTYFMLLFVLRIIWPSILNVILRLCLLMYAVRTFLCSWRNLWQLSVASLFIQIISPLIPAYDWDSLWEKPAWRIVGNQRNLKYINTSEAIHLKQILQMNIFF